MIPGRPCRHFATASRGTAAALRLNLRGLSSEAAPRKFIADDSHLRMRVKGDGANLGRLAGGILARARERLVTDLDAVGDNSVSNAVKALAMANAFAQQEGSLAGVAFRPTMALDASGTTRLMRLEVFPRQHGEGEADEDFTRGGIYVPVSSATASRRGRRRQPDDSSSPEKSSPSEDLDDDVATPPSVATPTELARTVLGHWVRFVAPEVRYAARPTTAPRPARPRDGSVGEVRYGRKRAPFLITMGPPAVSRAVKGLAFAFGDLGKEDRFSAVAPFVVVPRFTQRTKTDKYNGEETVTRLIALCMVRASAT